MANELNIALCSHAPLVPYTSGDAVVLSERRAFSLSLLEDIKKHKQKILEILDKFSKEDDSSNCLIWRGKKRRGENGNYYPVVTFGPYQKHGKMVSHVVWMCVHELPLPEEYVVMHTCSSSMCCSPSHLTAVHKSNKFKFSKLKLAGLVDEKIAIPLVPFSNPKLDKWYDYYKSSGKIQ